MRKRIIPAAIAVSLLLAALLPLAASARQALSIRKIVSVVFDDSGSMSANSSKNWAYANYAMQAFCGLLNKDDELYITYMSAYTTPLRIDLSGDKQTSVDQIRQHFDEQGTPVEAIDTAMRQLGSVQNADSNTQYWLVVITDGEFYRAKDSKQKNISQTELDKKFTSFVAEKMPNGTHPQVTYLAIGSGAMRPASDDARGIFVYPRNNDIVGGGQIVAVMSEMADKVSGRTRVPAAGILFRGDDTIEVSARVPLLNIAILTQNTDAKVTQAASAGAQLQLDQSARLLYLEQQGYSTDKTLKGGTALFNNGGAVIPAGRYAFKFSEAVNQDSIVVMYEPAIEMRLELTLQGGGKVTDPDSLLAGDTLDVASKIYETGTDKEIDPALLGAEVTYSLSYYEEDELIRENEDGAPGLKGIPLREIASGLQAVVHIEGYAPLTSALTFFPRCPVEYTMEAVLPADPEIARTSLLANGKGVTFVIYADGVPLTKAEAQAVDARFTMQRPYANRLELEVTLGDDGTYTCVPKYSCWGFPSQRFWNWTCAWAVPKGELVITGGIGSRELAEGSLYITLESLLASAFFLLLPFLILFCLSGWIFKRRFRPKTRAKVIDAQNRGTAFISAGANWSSKKLRRLTLWSLVPWLPARRKLAGVTFYARPGGLIGIRPGRVGAESRRLNGRTIKEDKVVNLPTATLPRSFVPKRKEERRQMKYQDFDIGEVLMEASSMHACKLIKFTGGK